MERLRQPGYGNAAANVVYVVDTTFTIPVLNQITQKVLDMCLRHITGSIKCFTMSA